MSKSCARFQPVKPGSEEHNRRLKPLDYIRTDLSKNNQSWSEQSVSDRLAELKQLVKTKTGRAIQKKATPIREAAVLIKPTTTMEDLKKLAAAYKEKFGINVFQIDIHKDEGHEDANGKWVSNLHAHVTADFIDHETGESLKLKPYQMSQLQDVTAEVLDMERGVSSNRQHLSALQFKIKAEREKLEELKQRVGPGAKLAALFKVGELAEIRSTLDTAVAASKEAEAGMKEAKKALSDTIKAHDKELATVREESRQRGVSDAIEAINKETSLKAASPADVVTAYKKALSAAKTASDSLQEQKKLTRSKEDIPARVNQVLKEYHLPTLDEKGLQEAEKVTKRSPFPFLGGYYARQELCQAIIDFCRQRQKVLNGDNTVDALKLLRQLWETLRQLWEGILRGLQASSRGGVISPGEAYEMLKERQGREFTKQAVIEDVEQHLRFTPFVVDTDRWEEALRLTPEQILAQYQTTARQQSDVEQHDQEQHIGEEQTRQKGWHR